MKKTALRAAGAAIAVPILLGGLALPAQAATASITAQTSTEASGHIVQPYKGYPASVRARTASIFTDVRKKNPWLGEATGIIQYAQGTASKKYKGGMIFGSPGGTSYAMKPAIRDAYFRYGIRKIFTLGYPMSAEIKLKDGGSVQRFTYGDIYWTAKGGAHHVPSALWIQNRGMTGRLGYPTSDWIKDGDKGYYQTFKGGKIVETNTKVVIVQPVTKVVFNK